NEHVHLSDVKVPAGVEFVGLGEESPVLATAAVIAESADADAAEGDDAAADAEKSAKHDEDDAKRASDVLPCLKAGNAGRLSRSRPLCWYTPASAFAFRGFVS